MKLRPVLPLACLLALAATVSFLPAAASPADRQPASAAPDSIAVQAAAARRVVVYYFHTTQRCATCRKIEQWSGEALTAEFGKELADSTLVFLPVNTDLEGNEHFLEDYQLYAKSLIVSDLVGGVQRGWENLPKIWEYTGSQEAFFKYVQDNVRRHLQQGSRDGRG